MFQNDKYNISLADEIFLISPLIMMRKFCILLLYLFCIPNLMAQVAMDDERDLQTEFNSTSGLRWHTLDSLFSMQLRFRMQNRFVYNTKSTDDFRQASAEAMVRRLRLRLNGNLGNPRLFYAIQLGFSIEDMDGDVNSLSNIIRDALAEYRLSGRLTIGMGQGKLPGNRERVNSSGDLQLVERSLFNRTFNIDRDFGAFFRYKGGKDWSRFNIIGSMSSGSGRNVRDNSEGFCYTARVEFLPLGDFTSWGDYFQGDIVREERPKVSIAIANAFNRNAIRTGSQIGAVMSEMKDINTTFADIIFKYRGFAWSAEGGVRRNSGSALTTNLAGDPVFIFRGYGYSTQASYCTKKFWEGVVRYTGIQPQDLVAYLTPSRRELTLGLTRYIRNHRVKLQSDVSYIEVMPKNGFAQSANFSFRFQIEVGI